MFALGGVGGAVSCTIFCSNMFTIIILFIVSIVTIICHMYFFIFFACMFFQCPYFVFVCFGFFTHPP